jgi:hypothetical protein
VNRNVFERALDERDERLMDQKIAVEKAIKALEKAHK